MLMNQLQKTGKSQGDITLRKRTEDPITGCFCLGWPPAVTGHNTVTLTGFQSLFYSQEYLLSLCFPCSSIKAPGEGV